MLGVVIGRFQTPYLHEGHQAVIDHARNNSDSLLILIGVSDAIGTDREPMNFETRKGLFKTNDIVLPLKDMPSDIDWSNQIDNIINNLGFTEAVLFGGRDNALEGRYFGTHRMKIIEAKGDLSASAIRKVVAKTPIASSDFRAGVIYQAMTRYPIVYSTVDVIIYAKDQTKTEPNSYNILMGRKGDKLQFIGGFVDPQDEDLDAAARRELREETGFGVDGCLLDLANLRYEFSHKVDDIRYKKTKDSIMTHVFSAFSETGSLPDPKLIQDKEFKEFVWVSADPTSLALVAEVHKPLFKLFTFAIINNIL